MLKAILALSIICYSFAYSADEFSGKAAMNGIAFKDYQDFPEKWSLVTIRFRKDTGEMRMTYANELAMKTMLSGSISYPDGAVFAKTAFHTSPDEQFISSVVPKGLRRYQIMVKDKSKYPSTGGWGYGLFDPDGKTFPEDPAITQNACYACHTIVENRGDVFSVPFSFANKMKFPDYRGATSHGVTFIWKKWGKLPVRIKGLLPVAHKSLRWLTHEKMRKNVFQGTLDELRPMLEQEARKMKAPAMFMSEDQKRFVVVIPGTTEECMGSGSFKVVSTDVNLKPVEEKYCTHD